MPMWYLYHCYLTTPSLTAPIFASSTCVQLAVSPECELEFTFLYLLSQENAFNRLNCSTAKLRTLNRMITNLTTTSKWFHLPDNRNWSHILSGMFSKEIMRVQQKDNPCHLLLSPCRFHGAWLRHNHRQRLHCGSPTRSWWYFPNFGTITFEGVSAV